MAKKALILNGEIVDVVATQFEVHSSMTWIDCPDECTPSDWKLNGSGNPIEKTPPADTRTYDEKREEEYNKLNQFEMQFDDKVNSTTTWVDKINEIKAKYPKP